MTIKHAAQGLQTILEEESENVRVGEMRLLVDALLRATARLPLGEVDGLIRRLHVVDAALSHVEVLVTLKRTPLQMADATTTLCHAVGQLALLARG